MCSGKKRKKDMKLSLLPKLVEKLVWVPVFRIVKFPYFADTTERGDRG
jgi:hypothetical protein